MNKGVALRFYLSHDRDAFAARYWNHVPRIGDEVMLRDVGDKRELVAYKVLGVLWCEKDVGRATLAAVIAIEEVK